MYVWALLKGNTFLVVSIALKITSSKRVLPSKESPKKARKLLRLSESRTSPLDPLKAKASPRKFALIAIISGTPTAIISISKEPRHLREKKHTVC
jgi:hypothetical protein